MGLLITVYLILTNMSISNHEFEASVFTAMDAWFVACRLLVGGALLEFALLIKLTTKAKVGPQQMYGKSEIDDKYRRYGPEVRPLALKPSVEWAQPA